MVGNPDVLRQSAGPQLRKLIHKLKAVIKVVHHLQNVSPKPDRPEPRMISRMVDLLAEMIKPAYPTEKTVDFIVGNAKNWGHTTYLILVEHYETSLDLMLEELAGMPTQDWRRAFEVAVRWVRRDLPRIDQDVIDHAEAVITARLQLEESMEPVQAPRQVSVDCSVQVQEPLQSKAVTFRAQTVQKKSTSVATMTDGDQEADWLPAQGPVLSPKDQRRRGGRKTIGVILNKPPFSWQFTSDSEENDLEEVPRVINHPTYLEEQGSTPVPSLRSPIQVAAQIHQTKSTLSVGSVEEERVNTPSPHTSSQVVTQASKALMTSLPLFSPDTSSEEEIERVPEGALDFSFSSSSPQPERFKVRRHTNTQRKLTDWRLEVEKKWIILGDSNVSQFPDFLNQDLQIESYPGSHFRHAHALIEKSNPPEDLVVEKVVLAFGINSRGNKLRETTMKTVQGAVRAIKKKFPLAEIWVPQINFSTNLPAEEKENLEFLNAYLKRNLPYIPAISDDQFQTVEDDIHWTSETASVIFKHWMRYLNFSAP